MSLVIYVYKDLNKKDARLEMVWAMSPNKWALLELTNLISLFEIKAIDLICV